MPSITRKEIDFRDETHQIALEELENLIGILRDLAEEMLQMLWFGSHASDGLSEKGCGYLYLKYKEELNDAEALIDLFQSPVKEKEKTNE